MHLNFPLREPLVSTSSCRCRDDSRARAAAPVRARHRVGSAERAERRDAARAASPARAAAWSSPGASERGEGLGAAAAQFARAAGWPLLADPLSGARRGTAAIAHYDALLRDPGFAARIAPDLVLRVGDLPVSKPLRAWLAGLDDVRAGGARPRGGLAGPRVGARARRARRSTRRPSSCGSADAAATAAPREGAEQDWLARWRSADERAAEAIVGVLGGDGLTEPRGRGRARRAAAGRGDPVRRLLDAGARHRDLLAGASTDPPRVLCNRGANGIDGTVSSRVRRGRRGAGGPVVLLIGDVALAHDIGGLLAARAPAS